MKVYIDWEEACDAADTLVERIACCNWHPHYLIAVTAGGLVPTALLSGRLAIKTIRTVGATHYSAQNEPARLQLFDIPHLPLEGAGCLFVDDVFDSGETAEALAALWPRAYFAALFDKHVYHAWKNVKPGRVLSGRDMPADEWLVFPWERQ